MEIRPILSTLSRHKAAAALIVLEVALSCAIICNALFLVSQRVEPFVFRYIVVRARMTPSAPQVRKQLFATAH